MKMRLLMVSLSLLLLLTGCTPSTVPSTGEPDQPLRVVTSFYPVYIYALNLLDGVQGVTLTNMVNAKVGCLHDYQLLPGDMLILQDADLFLISGSGMEGFLDAIASRIANLQVVNASEGILSLEENEEESHTWLSVPVAMEQVKNLSAALQSACPGQKEKIAANEKDYVARLEILHKDLVDGLATLQRYDLITFHEAFPLFAKEYGFTIVATLESEEGGDPGATAVAQAYDAIKEKGITALFVEPLYQGKAADSLASQTGAKVYILDPIVSGEMQKDAYENAMRNNLKTLQSALGQ